MKTEAVPTSVAVQNAIPQNVQKTNVQATPVMPKPAETTYQAPTSSQTNTSVGFQGSVQKPKTPNNIAAPAQSITIPQKSPTMAKPQSSFAVPGKVQPENVSQQTTESSEKPMSMFYLLQHYNKENAAIYKAQKEAKKVVVRNKIYSSLKLNRKFNIHKYSSQHQLITLCQHPIRL